MKPEEMNFETAEQPTSEPIIRKERVYLTEKDDVLAEESNLVTLVFLTGERVEHAEPRRLFPTSRPNSYITFLDESGKEVCVAREISDLNAESKKAVTASLNDYYLVPKILKILSITEKFGLQHWQVETDRGPRCFDVRNRIHDIRPLPDGRVRVRDSDDNRYIIPSLEGLDRASRQQMLADL